MPKIGLKRSNSTNRSHSKTAKKKKAQSPAVKGIRKTLRIIGKSFVCLILVFAITMSIVVTSLTVYVTEFYDPTYTIDLKATASGYSTIFYAANGEGQYEEIKRIHSQENREWVYLQEIPQHVVDAFVYTEDKRFYEHDGVDWWRSFQAFANLFLNFYSTQQGGSTITQQLIKNVTGEKDNSIERKVQEIFNALNLEKSYSKDQILESYLNIIALDNNVAGVQAAAKYYFGKNVSELTVPEAAALAAMTRSPRGYSIKANPDKNAVRREYVYEQMLENGAITQAEYDEYCVTEVLTVFDTGETTEGEEGEPNEETGGETTSSTSDYGWYTDATIEQVKQHLIERAGYTESEAETAILSGGLQIYTAMDTSMQTIIEQKFLDVSTFSSSEENMAADKVFPQAAMIIMDYDGNILAVAGGRGERNGERVFNRATSALRHPGSAIKPLSAYTPAIERNLVTYSSLMDDSPLMEVEGNPWPSNYDNHYQGNVLLNEAVRRSFNTIPAKLVNLLSPQTSLDFLQDKLHFTTLTDADADYAPLSVGAFSEGVTLKELTSAFQIFGNDGIYKESYFYTTVTDVDGNIILQNENETTRAVSSETATVMNRLLREVVQSGTGTAANLGATTVVGKTGTSSNPSGNGERDRSFVGCTPDYVAGVWYGYDHTNKPQVDADGNQAYDEEGNALYTSTEWDLYYSRMYSPTQIWKNVMQDIVSSREVTANFTLNSTVEEQHYCVETGGLAVEGLCTSAVGYYKPNAIPSPCPLHSSGVTSNEGGETAGSGSNEAA